MRCARSISPPDGRSSPATSSSWAIRSPDHVFRQGGAAGIRPRVRRADRQARVDVQHDSQARRVRLRDAGCENSAEYTGSTNVWSSGIYDPELDYVYLPTSTPTNNYYGGHRPGDNLFAESLVCVEAKTGKRVWHFQAVHHGIWDYDFPTHPILGDITVERPTDQGGRFRSASRRSPTCSIAKPASRCGRSKSGPCPRPQYLASAPRRRSRSRPSRRPSTCREPPKRT